MSAARAISDAELARAIAESPWEQGMRGAMESGVQPVSKVCQWCLMNVALPGTKYCSEFCELAGEVMSVFGEEE